MSIVRFRSNLFTGNRVRIEEGIYRGKDGVVVDKLSQEAYQDSEYSICLCIEGRPLIKVSVGNLYKYSKTEIEEIRKKK